MQRTPQFTPKTNPTRNYKDARPGSEPDKAARASVPPEPPRRRHAQRPSAAGSDERALQLFDGALQGPKLRLELSRLPMLNKTHKSLHATECSQDLLLGRAAHLELARTPCIATTLVSPSNGAKVSTTSGIRALAAPLQLGSPRRGLASLQLEGGDDGPRWASGGQG